MTSWLCRLAFLAALAPTAGCIIEIGDGDDDPPPCYDTTLEYVRVRDPYTGQCYQRGGGGHCQEDDVVIQAKTSPPPDGGRCDTYCEGLDEDSCTADPGCQAAYVFTHTLVPERFAGCWAIAPSAQPGACQDLGAEGCAGRNDCSPLYLQDDRGRPDPSFPMEYFACAPEQPVDVCASDLECGPGQHCNLQNHCYPHPDCRDGQACPPVCYGRCEPVSPEVGECTGVVACLRPAPACPPSTVPGIVDGCWSGYCIPVSECGHDPGHCPRPGEPACFVMPPACPAGTVPGVENMCWTGYCIPQWACD